jgi:hypothetical protein
MSIIRRVAAVIMAWIGRLLAERVEAPAPAPALPSGVSATTDYTIVSVDHDTIKLGVPESGPEAPAALTVAGPHGFEIGDTLRLAAPTPNGGPPLFICDFSHWDGVVDVDAYLADRRYVGAWVKLTQGTGGYKHEAYGVALARRLIAAAKKTGRLGVDFWIGAYGYLNFDSPGAPQATYLYRAHREAGILDVAPACRLRAMMDVERGSVGSANYDDGGAKVTACATAFAARWLALTGTRPIAYGRGAWRDLKLRGLLGCSGLVNPAYTRDMPSMLEYGVPRSSIVAQQYTDGVINRTSFPALPPGAHAADTSVLLGPRRGELADLETARRALVWGA